MGLELDLELMARLDQPAHGAYLWSVWIDVNMGHAPAEWWENSPPKLLEPALTEAAACRQSGFPVRVLREGERPQGRAFRYDDV